MITSMLRRAMLSGDGSTLNLDFTQMSTLADLTSRGFTFSRSTSGTFMNASGLVATATAGNPRFEYDTNGNPLGLLIEGSANNFALNSNAMASGSYTAAIGASKTPTAGTAPDNSNDAARVTFTQRFSNLNQPISTTAGVTYTVSFWVKRESGNSNLSIYHQFSATGNSTAITVTTSWQRVSVPVLGRTGNGNIEFGIIDTNTSGWGSVLVWGFQVETGSGASSLIVTGASTGNRAADNCYADSISSWYTQGSGTMLFFGRPTVPSTRTMLNFSVGTNVPRIQMYGSTSTDVTCYLENPSGTGANVVSPSGTLVNGTAFKSAWAFETGNHAACINAGTVATASTSSPAVPSSGITRLNIGMRYDGFNQFNGHVISAKYWPTRLADATLQAITTL